MTFVVDSCALLSCRIFSTLINKKKILCISLSRFHMDIKDEAKSTMELVNVPPIISIYRHALLTFDDKYKRDFATNLSKLKLMMNGLRADDLGFNKSINDPASWGKNTAPCKYIEVFQNDKINMSIFVLRPGFKMPLHDHPHMHGLLKVISGAVNIRSFTEYPLNVDDTPLFRQQAKDEAERLSEGVHRHRRLFAEISTDRKCAANSETCMLTPTISNYHEIQALEMPAAFFDILSPPYDTMIENIGPRRCHYYHIVNKLSSNLVELEETEVPECFYCDQLPYLGPILG